VSIAQEARAAVNNPDAEGAGASGKRRSGSENRQRTRHKKLSLLETEERVLQELADEKGLSIQMYIVREFVEPLVGTST
jgi:hypothetical protein